MKLIDAYNLLVEDGAGNNHRYFADVYKLYGFNDQNALKEYLDFIAHEPTHWMRGFPAKLRNKLTFSKPKTAIIKLLKKQEVVDALGEDYTLQIYDKVWNTFKREADTILTERNTLPADRTVSPTDRILFPEDHTSFPTISTYEESVGTVDIIEPPPTLPFKQKQDSQVEFLKQVILKMTEALPAGYADAFRLLVSRV